MMECLNAIKFLTVLLFFHVTDGQTLSLAGTSLAPQGNNTVFTCTANGGTTTQLQWIDSSVAPAKTIFSNGGRFSNDDKYTNFQLTSETTTTSVMTIENTNVTDEGSYGCTTPDAASSSIDLEVEVQSERMLTLSSKVTNNEDFYEATCEAIGSKPVEIIGWIRNGVMQFDGDGNTIETTNPPATSPLSNTRSVYTFPATQENHGQSLVCDITGHQLTELNGQIARNLDIHNTPTTAGTIVTVVYETQRTGIKVLCNAQNEPKPMMRNYYIYSNDTQIYESTEGGKEVPVLNPEAGTNYTCMAGNYLGNTTLSEPVTYDPTRTTTPPPTTEPITTEGPTTEPTAGTSTSPTTTGDDGSTMPPPGGLSPGAIGGIAVGAILCIVIVVIIILCVLKKGKEGSSGGHSSKKHTSSAVGSSNGSEKEKIKPTAAPRDQGSIQHTTDNPQQAEYAMVDRKKPGGDMPDRGSSQNESPGMHYADLDLSANAGHNERHVPQNPDNVVVYSSILV